jgi:hypothetical protein
MSITVNPLVDVVWLPETLRALATPTPIPTATLPPTATPTQPTSTPTPVPPTRTPTPTPLQGDVLLDYTEAGTLLVRNIAGGPIDLSGLVLRQGERQQTAASWQSFMLSTNLSQFPAGGCIRLWAAAEPPRGQPAGCGWPNAGITIPPQDRVWMGGEFEAVWQGDVIETCPPAPDRCVLDLPD